MNSKIVDRPRSAAALIACAAACALLLSCSPRTPAGVTSSPAVPTSNISPTSSPQRREPAATAAATSAPPPGRIVYTCQVFAEALQDQICVMDASGGAVRRLTNQDDADHFYPSWSPDGASILFSSNLAGGYEIFELALGGGLHQLTQHGRAYAPAVSPAGQQLAYTVRSGEDTALWLAERDGSGARWLTGPAWDAAWSPDGAWILHASDRDGTIQLWVIRPDGSELRRVTQLQELRGRNDWSPDGERIATYAGPSWNREIVSFDPQGGDVRQLSDGGNNLAPSFSPYGGWLTFTSYQDRYRDENGCEIYIMTTNGQEVRRLTDNEYCDWQPRWGP